LLRAYGIELVDFETGTILPNEDGLKKLLDAYKPYYTICFDYSRYIENVTPEHLTGGAVIFESLWYINNFFEKTSQLKTKDDFEIFVIPGIDGHLSAVAALSTMGIRSGSPNQQNAWNFIKLMLSSNFQSSFTSGSPIHIDSIKYKVEYSHGFFDGAIHNGNVIHTKLSDAEKQAYLDIILNVDDCFTYESRPVQWMFNDHMTPYLEDKVSYETAIAGLRNQLRLYISE
jgi:ABC-type glycerol-3-phosphate transport system substrate-binding protein